uniref:G_PROTEIN_RECEP_F1_2 domain-containing protein n=2 Tax=Bursaphelenchus xylophilus TaxID=6326 RepID=A0A1I7S9B2_BURXY
MYKTLGAMALAVGYSLVDSTWLMPFVEINGDKSDKELLQGGCDTSSIHKHVVFSKRLPGASTYSTLHRAYVIGSSVIVLYYGTITILHIRKVYHAMSRKAIVLNHRLNRLFCVQLIMLIGLNVLPMIGFIFTDSVSTLLGNIIGIARAFGQNARICKQEVYDDFKEDHCDEQAAQSYDTASVTATASEPALGSSSSGSDSEQGPEPEPEIFGPAPYPVPKVGARLLSVQKTINPIHPKRRPNDGVYFLEINRWEDWGDDCVGKRIRLRNIAII